RLFSFFPPYRHPAKIPSIPIFPHPSALPPVRQKLSTRFHPEPIYLALDRSTHQNRRRMRRRNRELSGGNRATLPPDIRTVVTLVGDPEDGNTGQDDPRRGDRRRLDRGICGRARVGADGRAQPGDLPVLPGLPFGPELSPPGRISPAIPLGGAEGPGGLGRG